MIQPAQGIGKGTFWVLFFMFYNIFLHFFAEKFGHVKNM